MQAHPDTGLPTPISSQSFRNTKHRYCRHNYPFQIFNSQHPNIGLRIEVNRACQIYRVTRPRGVWGAASVFPKKIRSALHTGRQYLIWVNPRQNDKSRARSCRRFYLNFDSVLRKMIKSCVPNPSFLALSVFELFSLKNRFFSFCRAVKNWAIFFVFNNKQLQ